MRQQLNVVFVCQRIEVKPILPPKLIFYIIDIIGTTTITIEVVLGYILVKRPEAV